MVGWTESPKQRRVHWLMSQWMHDFVKECEADDRSVGVVEDFTLENPEEWEIREPTDEGERICDGFALLEESGDMERRAPHGGQPRALMRRPTPKRSEAPLELLHDTAPFEQAEVRRRPPKRRVKREPVPRGEPVKQPPPPLYGLPLVQALRMDIADPLARYEVFWVRAVFHWGRAAKYNPIRPQDWEIAASMISHQIRPPDGSPKAIGKHDECEGKGCHKCLNTGFRPAREIPS